MRHPLRVLGCVALLLAAAVWISPALLVAYALPRLAERAGGAIALERVRPDFPLGVSIARARVVRGGKTLELAELRARATPGGLRLDARVGEGSVLVRTDGPSARSGFVRAAALPLEVFDGFAIGGLRLRGVADGVYRFGPRSELEATIHAGSIVLGPPLGVELPFALLTLAAARETDGVWKIPFADVRGPPLSATASGEIGARGELALRAEIAELAEPALSGFALLKLPTAPLPYTAEIGGSLGRPTFTPLANGAP